MASNIICNTEVLESKADQMRAYIKTERTILTNLDKKLNSLGYVWKGSASLAFLLNYTLRKVEIRNFLDTLDEFAELLQTSAERFDKTDEEMRRKVNNV